MSVDSCFFFDHYDQIICSSGTSLTPLSVLKDKSISKACFAEAETVLQVLLLRADLFFQHKFDLEKNFVCDAHYKELVKGFPVRPHSVCETCVFVRGNALQNKGSLRYISVAQSIS